MGGRHEVAFEPIKIFLGSFQRGCHKIQWNIEIETYLKVPQNTFLHQYNQSPVSSPSERLIGVLFT